MIGTDKELSIIFWGEDSPLEIRNVEKVEELKSSHGIRVTTQRKSKSGSTVHMSLRHGKYDLIFNQNEGKD